MAPALSGQHAADESAGRRPSVPALAASSVVARPLLMTFANGGVLEVDVGDRRSARWGSAGNVTPQGGRDGRGRGSVMRAKRTAHPVGVGAREASSSGNQNASSRFAGVMWGRAAGEEGADQAVNSAGAVEDLRATGIRRGRWRLA